MLDMNEHPTTIKVSDDSVTHVWKSINSDEVAHVHPGFYESSGTPIDDEGDDMTYEFTSVALPHKYVAALRIVYALRYCNCAASIQDGVLTLEDGTTFNLKL